MLIDQIVQKRNRILGIPTVIGLNEALLGRNINRAIVGLLGAFIDDRDFYALIGFAPHITTQIPPQ